MLNRSNRSRGRFVSVLGAVSTIVPFAILLAATDPGVTITVKDLTPKFLAFYDRAIEQRASPDQRWELWKSLYHFAAVPPTPAGDNLARYLLDRAWPRYPSTIGRIRAGSSHVATEAQRHVNVIAGLLHPEQDVHVELLVYVGGFEDNAFTAAHDNKITVAIPIESAPAVRERLMTHEFTHAVQIGMGSFSGSFQRTIGTIVITEGLASRVTQSVYPNRSETDSIEFTRGWLKEAEAHRREILNGIRPYLASDTSADIQRFTIGPGPTGLEREAYYAGWLVIGHWLAQGMTFADIARIPETEMPRRAAAAIEQLLATR